MGACCGSTFCGLKINLSHPFSFTVRASQPYSEKAVSPRAQNTSQSGHKSFSFHSPKQTLQVKNGKKDPPGRSWGLGLLGGEAHSAWGPGREDAAG